jgi:CheY-like chemotaxis protein
VSGPIPEEPGRGVPVIRVLVADDQRVVREGLVMLLGLLPGVEVVGAAADGEQAVARATAPRRSPTPTVTTSRHDRHPDPGQP